MKNRRMKQMISFVLCVAMVLGYIPATVSAAEQGLCAHHQEHTGCSYVAAVASSECTHQHDEACHTATENCTHVHDGCGMEEIPCVHECNAEAGCITSQLNCGHVHNGDCGYAEGAEEVPCDFVCAECAEDEEEPIVSETTVPEVAVVTVLSEPEVVCTCESDDPDWHAPFCALFVMPENPVCYCAEKCTEEAVNEWCEVCYFDLTACGGEGEGVPFTVTWNINGEMYDETEVIAGETVTAPDFTVPEGYTFSNWEIPTVMPAEDITLNATLTANKYEISYKFQVYDGAYDVRQELAYGSALEFTGTIPERESYEFDYWAYFRSENDEPYAEATVPAENLYAIAVWKETAKHTITWNINGKEYAKTLVASGGTIVVPEYTVAEGYTFSGWKNVPATMPDEDITLDATLTVNQYKVTYKFMVSTAVPDVIQNQEYGTELAFAGTIPNCPGFEFVGWQYFYSSSGELYEGTTVPDGNLLAMAIWTERSNYIVTWTINGEYHDETEVKAGETITAPDYIVPEGYTFSGWDIPKTMPAEDIELDATLTVNQYKVTWTVDGAKTEVEYTYGVTIEAPEDPSKEGNRCVSYSFKMWEGFAEGMTMPAEDLEFIAVFEVTEKHIDRNRDHICDRKCGKTDIGEHADSATDKDHRCDYGCKAILEACSDKDGDRNHNCDICRKKNVTAHTYTEATCTKPATCTECGAKHGKLKAHTWNDGVVLKKPTCTKPGVMGFKCKDCQKSRIEMIKPEGHDWDNGKEIKKATCTKDGVKAYTCESCRATKMVKIQAVGHDYHNGVCRNCHDKKFNNHGFHGWWHPWWK